MSGVLVDDQTHTVVRAAVYAWCLVFTRVIPINTDGYGVCTQFWPALWIVECEK